MPDLQINIRTTADTSGAQEATRALGETSAAAKQIQSTQSDVLSAQEKSDAAAVAGDGGPALDTSASLATITSGSIDATKALGGLAEAAHKTTISKSGLKAAIRSLSHDFPLFGTAMKFLFNPYTAIVAVIASFVVAIKKQIDAQKEAAEESGRLSAALDPVNVKTHTHDVNATQAAISARKHAEAMREVAREADSAEKKMKRLNDETDRQLKIANANGDPAENAKRTQQAEEIKAARLVEADRKMRADAAAAGAQLPGEEATLAAVKDAAAQKAAQRKAMAPDLEKAQKDLAEAESMAMDDEKSRLFGFGPRIVINPFAKKHNQEVLEKQREARARVETIKAQMGRFAGQEESDKDAIDAQQERVDRLKKVQKEGDKLRDPAAAAVADAMAGRKILAAKQAGETAGYQDELMKRASAGIASGDISRGAGVKESGMFTDSRKWAAQQNAEAMGATTDEDWRQLYLEALKALAEERRAMVESMTILRDSSWDTAQQVSTVFNSDH